MRFESQQTEINLVLCNASSIQVLHPKNINERDCSTDVWYILLEVLNKLRPRQNGRHFLNDKASISIKISLKFVPKGSIDNSPKLVQIMAWCRPDDKPLSAPMMVSLLTHICVTRPQWVNTILAGSPVQSSYNCPIQCTVLYTKMIKRQYRSNFALVQNPHGCHKGIALCYSQYDLIYWHL